MTSTISTAIDTYAETQGRDPSERVARDGREISARYAARVNPKWVALLDLLEMNAVYTTCVGSELTTSDGRTVLDFLSGYCVYNTGHNHPRILAEVEAELRRLGPTMLQSHVPPLAAELASELCERAGGKLTKVFFTSSGSEGVETAIKFARARTGRPGILYCDGAFHGLTTGALSLMSNPWWREGFGPLLPDTVGVPFGDLDALEGQLARRTFAAFVVEPVQAESGVLVPPADYLSRASELCRRHGTLLVLDEVQTGLHRTGPFLAAHRFGVEPDMLILAKALSGGLIPVGAVLTTDAVHGAVYSSLSRSFVHASTFGENALAMRAGLASLSVLEDERLGARSEQLGDVLRSTLTERLQRFEMFEEVRGVGLLNALVFRRPQSLARRTLFDAFGKVHAGMFGQMVVRELYLREGILTQMCGNNFLALKVAPPLTSTEAQIERFVDAAERTLERVHSGPSFWTGSLAMARRAVGI